jgi:cell division protein FtsB
MFQKLYTRITPLVIFVRRHLFGCAMVIMASWLLIFGEHSIAHLLRYKHQQANLETEIAAYRDSIAAYESQIQALTEGDDCLEQFAREHLLMKREQEDIFLIHEP